MNNLKFNYNGEKNPFFSDTEIYSFPYCKYFIEIHELEKMFKLLIEYRMRIEPDKKYKPYGINCNGLFLGKSIIFAQSKAMDYYFTYITDYFQENCRLECRRNNQGEKFIKFFDKQKAQMAKNILNLKYTITYKRIWAEIFKLRYQLCSEFDPAWMVNIVSYLKNFIPNFSNKIIDSCAGHGSRMIGAAALGCDYMGVDPSECCNCNYGEQIKFLTRMNPNNKYTVIKSPYEEDFELPEWMPAGEIDLMFSSPPYFNLEIYENTDTQSINKFPTMSRWLEGFLYPLMNKTMKLLKTGGIMCINIDNPRNQNLDYVNPMLKHTRGYMGLITIARTNMRYSFWCWQKK